MPALCASHRPPYRVFANAPVPRRVLIPCARSARRASLLAEGRPWACGRCPDRYPGASTEIRQRPECGRHLTGEEFRLLPGGKPGPRPAAGSDGPPGPRPGAVQTPSTTGRTRCRCSVRLSTMDSGVRPATRCPASLPSRRTRWPVALSQHLPGTWTAGRPGCRPRDGTLAERQDAPTPSARFARRRSEGSRPMPTLLCTALLAAALTFAPTANTAPRRRPGRLSRDGPRHPRRQLHRTAGHQQPRRDPGQLRGQRRKRPPSAVAARRPARRQPRRSQHVGRGCRPR